MIVFPDEWIAYSPTILNLYTCLKPDYDVRIISFQLDIFRNDVEFDDIQFIRINSLRYKLLRRLNRYKWYKNLLLKSVLKREQKNQYDLVFGVDTMGFLACKQVFDDVVFLSLEISNDEMMEQARQQGITDLIIQSQERKEFLLGKNSDTRIHYVQNAPIINDNLESKSKNGKRLIYFGNIKPYYGIDHCIQALKYLPQDYSLTLKGIRDEEYYEELQDRYLDLIDMGQLRFDFSYTPQDKVIDYLKAYDIGFCLFDFGFGNENNFNYLSSPSGKLFNYYAAGIPVIGNDIVGFRSVRDYNTGILLKDIRGQQIADAIEMIEVNFALHSKNCIKAGREFDFKTAFDRFLETVTN